jgi:hypothetical protein
MSLLVVNGFLFFFFLFKLVSISIEESLESVFLMYSGELSKLLFLLLSLSNFGELGSN